ncbi:hypothetical protein NG2371_06800 [Nocardia gamkensis]|nr:hypothetical protein [Nocardia gamkensis]
MALANSIASLASSRLAWVYADHDNARLGSSAARMFQHPHRRIHRPHREQVPRQANDRAHRAPVTNSLRTDCSCSSDDAAADTGISTAARRWPESDNPLVAPLVVGRLRSQGSETRFPERRGSTPCSLTSSSRARLADLADVRRPTITTWSTRHDDFPRPEPGSRHVRLPAAIKWLDRRPISAKELQDGEPARFTYGARVLARVSTSKRRSRSRPHQPREKTDGWSSMSSLAPKPPGSGAMDHTRTIWSTCCA